VNQIDAADPGRPQSRRGRIELPPPLTIADGRRRLRL
jgi:hypothetical protein